MNLADEFLTIESETQAELKIKGSRFIGTVVPAQNIAEAEQRIAKISRQYYNATHNCFAYRIKLFDQIVTKQHDAGEPFGTAGLPILNVIISHNLFNLVVVITRYFGGTKLGKGGLVRAYTDCTKAVLNKSVFEKKCDLSSVTFSFSYRFTGNVMHLISQCNGKISSSLYGQDVRLTVNIPKNITDYFKSRVVEITSGNLNFS